MKKTILFLVVLVIQSSIATIKLNAQTWLPVGTGTNNLVRTLTVYNGDLYAGGNFTTAGGIAANYIAKWDETTWSVAGTGMNNQVLDIIVYNGNLYAGGNFTTAGGTTVNGIAKWDGATWSALGTGMNNSVRALAVYNGDLYAGGSFTTAGGVAVNYIAKWDGTTWSAVGAGMCNWITAMTVYKNELYVGGMFDMWCGGLYEYIAKWDGAAWSAVGTGMAGGIFLPLVQELTSNSTYLYATGDFTTAGGTAANYIAQWDGTTWSALGSGTGFSMSEGLYLSNGILYVGGTFTTAGGSSANRIAQWNGTTWSAMAAGMNNRVDAITTYNNYVYAGGLFTTADGNAATYIAKWDQVLLPIELLSFDATLQSDKTVLCEWETATEINNDYFTIEKTTDGITFELVAQVDGAGNSNVPLYYNTPDDDPYQGISYYRLKQTDFNGDFSYSDLRPINLEGVDIINLSPNPAVDNIEVLVYSSNETKVDVNLYNMLGQSIKVVNQVTVAEGSNKLQLDVSLLSIGYYTLEVSTESGLYRSQKKLVIK